MDSVLNLKNFPLLEPTIDKNSLKNIRLLCVFGCNGAEVILSTDDDTVFSFGRNRFGGLALGSEEENIDSPRLNPFLSNKNIVNLFCGFEHWIALTSSGRCLSWGHNQFGQLGAGEGVGEMTNTPILIQQLATEVVVDISCGAAHTIALTSAGQVYGWGDNQYGQCGDGSTQNRFTPRPIFIREEVESISCGRNHSIALTVSGKVYVWGLNSYGQLGYSVSNNNKRFISSRPELITDFEDKLFSKAICGPNYSLLLSTDGYIYSFGDNTCGQCGNGSTEDQRTPFLVSKDIQFKDIIAHKENDISIAVATDNRVFVWGLAKNRRYLSPKLVSDGFSQSVFDIYAIYAKKNVTFKTIVVDNRLKSWERIQRITKHFQGLEDFEVREELNQNCDTFSVTSEAVEDNNNDMESEDNGWHQIKRSKPKKPKTRKTTLDKLMDIKTFLKNPTIIDESWVRQIRLMRVFGLYGSKVIFATNEDKVYAFGHNRDLSLGLGTNEEHILKPELIKELSGQQLIDIATGYEHSIGLTASGLCYGWGQNSFGQLGIGTIQPSKRPKLIDELIDTKVVQISCGSYHSLALTSDGQLFSWGHNTFAQLGDRTYNSREKPTQVMIPEEIRYICCGLNHSAALTSVGKIYIWGGNEKGQLGRPPEQDIRQSREKPMSNRPHVIKLMEDIVISKVVCGSNHTLLLSSDGDIYAFGENSCGQVGNGTTQDQFKPIKLNKDSLKIKDIISHFDNDMSIAVADNDNCFVWGFVHQKNVCRPTEITNTSGKSLFDIYAKFAKHKVTFKTIVVEEDADNYVIKPKSTTHSVMRPSKPVLMTSESISYSQIIKNSNQKAAIDTNCDQKSAINANYNSNCDITEDKNSFDKPFSETEEQFDYDIDCEVENNINEVNEVFHKSHNYLQNIQMSNGVEDMDLYNESIIGNDMTVSGKIFISRLRQSFDRRNYCDVRIRSGDRIIYCHKTVLKIRNEKFWQLLSQELTENNEIIINSNTYDLFYAFLQYLYTIRPSVEPVFAKELQNMARLFGERELEDLCAQYIPKQELIIGLDNVCQLYEKAVGEGITDLEIKCVEFAANNWKSVVKSDDFHSLDDILSKRLMISVLSK